MSTQLTRARVERLASEIKQVKRRARSADPATKGAISYPYLCGGMEATVCGLVDELAGPAAAALIKAAFAASDDGSAS
ncbi:hypothetical protein [Rhizobacter sp. OV335]|uniref:hypothetical protein n=1 Tax=Rhizobacter sp. OV335 TaxID=1500264 RepID=UPI0009186E2D|nr:hypothetical protein [Rhizobacter sp. OV335]SHN40609.1 hypothetical protein SAMN02787076_06284 [Rhizobacter sp. OV335]